MKDDTSGGDEALGRLDIELLVLITMRVEPLSIVVRRKPAKKIEGLARESGEGLRRCSGPAQAVPSTGPSATFSVTLYSRYMPSINRVCASSAGSTLNSSPTIG